MKKNKFFLALYAVTSIIFIELVGRLMLAEIVALLNLPLINIKLLIKKYQGLKVVLISLLILLASLIFSDLINQSAPADYLRGWAVIIFAMISMIFFVYHLSNNPKNIIYYLFALFFVNLIFGQDSLNLSEWYTDTNYFKVRFVIFLNPAIMLLVYYLYSRKQNNISNLLLLLYGIICMILDARSNGLIFILSSITLFIKFKEIRLTKVRIIAYSIISVLVLYTAYIVYVDQVLKGNIGGQNAKTQLRMASNPYNPFELLYYGRVEFVVLIYAIIDKPFIGHGSWGPDIGGKYARIESAITGSGKYFGPAYINTHSIFLGTWVYAGIIGFIATLFMFYTLFKYYFIIYKKEIITYLFPIITVLFYDMLWAYFFSPIGTFRTSFPIFAAIVIVEYNRHAKISENKQLN